MSRIVCLATSALAVRDAGNVPSSGSIEVINKTRRDHSKHSCSIQVSHRDGKDLDRPIYFGVRTRSRNKDNV
jgi:hypothetical protein